MVADKLEECGLNTHVSSKKLRPLLLDDCQLLNSKNLPIQANLSIFTDKIRGKTITERQCGTEKAS